MKKELTIAAKFDTSDFDKSVDRMQTRLKDLYSPADQVRAQTQTASRLNQLGIGVQGPGAADQQRNMQKSRRDLDLALKEEYQGQEKLVKLISKREEKLISLKNQQKELVRGSKEELEIAEKIGRVRENISRQNEIFKQRDSVINQAINARQGLSEPGGGGFSAAGIGLGAARALRGIGGVLGGIGAIGKTAEQFTGYGQRLEAARGSAIQNTSGQDLERIYAGKSPFESQYMPERTEAAGLAAQKAGRNRLTDRAKGLGSLGLIAGGIGVGAASLFGAPMTAGASMLGLGAAGTMIGGGIAGLSNDRSRQGILGGKEYEQLLASQQAKDFRQTLQDLKEQDPGKKLALDDFEQNYQKNVQSQRMLGLSNKEFYGEGGFKQKAANAGFMPDQAIGMAQSIVGAGGSARMGKEATFGLQMERSGLTNAGGILGSLSGSIQNPESTKRATIGIISEAFKIGLDNTDFAEENRRFTQAAATIIGRTGATGQEDQDRLTQALGQFLGERTNRGVEAAGGAYERSQERGSQLGGRRGAMRFSSAMRDPNLSKLGTAELTELLGMRPEDIRSDSAAVRTFARDAGFEGKDDKEKVAKLQETLKKNANGSRFLVPNRGKEFGGYGAVIDKYMKETGLTYQALVEKSRVPGALPADVDEAFGKQQILASEEEKGGLKTSEQEAAVGEFHAGEAVSFTERAAAKVRTEDQGNRLEDEFTAKGAKGADEARKNFDEMTDSIWKLAGAAKEFVNTVAPTAGQLSDTARQRQATMPKGNGSGTDIVGPMLQPQAGSRKGQ